MGDESSRSPFGRSGKIARSPPSTPIPSTAVKENVRDQERDQIVPVSTAEIDKWMTYIEQYLNEICSISTEGKLNTEQKLKVHNLCRKVSNGTSLSGT